MTSKSKTSIALLVTVSALFAMALMATAHAETEVIGDMYDLGCGGYGICNQGQTYTFDPSQNQAQAQSYNYGYSYNYDFSNCRVVSDIRYILVPSIPHYYQFMPVEVGQTIVC